VSYLKKALMLTSDHSDPVVAEFIADFPDTYEEEFGKAAVALANFVKLINGDEDLPLDELYMASGYPDLSLELKGVLGHLMMRITMSAYYSGAVEARDGSYDPFIFGDMTNVINDPSKSEEESK